MKCVKIKTMETIHNTETTSLQTKKVARKWRKQFLAFWFNLIGTLTFFILSLVTDSYMLQPFYVSLAIVGTVLLSMNISQSAFKSK